MRHLLISLMVLVTLSVSAAAQQMTAAEKYSNANALIADGEYAQAAEVLVQAEALVSDPKKSGRELRADILFALGKALFYKNELEKSEASLKESASIRKEKHSDTYVYLGLVSLGGKDTAAATRYLNIAIATDSKNAEAWYELGKLLYAEGNSARAKVAFEKAVELGSSRSTEAKASLSKIGLGSDEPLAAKGTD